MVNPATPYWEIDPSKLFIKDVIVRTLLGTTCHGIYDDKNVTVKLLYCPRDAKSRTAFTQEVAVWQNLDHPNVSKFIAAKFNSSGLQTIQSCTSANIDHCCFVEEHLPEGDLGSYCLKNSETKLAFKVVVQLALDIARGLSYLHSQNIIHRDVNPENMLLDKGRRVKISSFGVARVYNFAYSLTANVGTYRYGAPEVFRQEQYNRKRDVYSFGISLWEIYCCEKAFPDMNLFEMMESMVDQNLRPEIPGCCPSSLADVIKQCWDSNPDNRPEMVEVISMLEAIGYASKGGGHFFKKNPSI